MFGVSLFLLMEGDRSFGFAKKAKERLIQRVIIFVQKIKTKSRDDL
jgi:hypothetical protein